MIEYKSDVFVFFLYVFIVFTLLLKLSAFVETLNPLNLIAPTLATVVGIMLIQKNKRVVSWIRVWATVEIGAGLLFVVGRGCSLAFLEDPPSLVTELFSIMIVVLAIVIASAFYFLAPDYIVEVKEPKKDGLVEIYNKQMGAP